MSDANGIESCPVMQNVLMWDVHEGEWRVGHVRRVGVEETPIAMTVREANDAITDGEPILIFARVSHWSRLPADVAAVDVGEPMEVVA